MPLDDDAAVAALAGAPRIDVEGGARHDRRRRRDARDPHAGDGQDRAASSWPGCRRSAPCWWRSSAPWPASGSVVMEGRDIGTVVFPEAPVKIYLDADPAERARRRAHDPAHQSGSFSVAAVATALDERDADRSRPRRVAARDGRRCRAPRHDAPVDRRRGRPRAGPGRRAPPARADRAGRWSRMAGYCGSPSAFEPSSPKSKACGCSVTVSSASAGGIEAEHVGEILDLGQIGEVVEAELVEEVTGGAVHERPADDLLAADHLHQLAAR